MGHDTSKAIGTDFDDNERHRLANMAAEDLPSIPFLKQKVIMAQMETSLKQSIFFQNFKRAFRGYLRKNPERNQTGTLFRIHTNSMRDGTLLGLPRDSYKILVDKIVVDAAPDLYEDSFEFLIGRGKLSAADPIERKKEVAEAALTVVFRNLTDTFMQQTGKKLYEKYSRGEDYATSDVEIDPETRAKMAAAKAEKLKKAAEERQRQAAEWQKQAEEEQRAQEAREAEIQRRQREAAAIKEASLI